eukprot:771667-Pyramimonas_sp.AAC.1
MRSADDFVVMTDVQVSSAGPVRAASPWAKLPAIQNNTRTPSARPSLPPWSEIFRGQLSSGTLMITRHIWLTACFPVQKSPTGRLPRRA